MKNLKEIKKIFDQKYSFDNEVCVYSSKKDNFCYYYIYEFNSVEYRIVVSYDDASCTYNFENADIYGNVTVYDNVSNFFELEDENDLIIDTKKITEDEKNDIIEAFVKEYKRYKNLNLEFDEDKDSFYNDL